MGGGILRRRMEPRGRKQLLFVRRPLSAPKVVRPNTMVKTLLVIGGGGYIGSTVTFNALTTTDMNVIVFDKLMYGGSSLFQFFSLEKRFEFVYGDVRMGIPKWTAFLKEHAVDFVFNAAALVGEHICKKYPQDAQEINEDASIDVAEACAAAKCARYIFASTCSNYGMTEDFVDESAPTYPLSLYATTKINTENHLLNPKSCPGLACTVLRFATIYGLAARVRFDLLVHEFIRDCFVEKRLEIYGPDGWRPFLHVNDAARAVILICAQHDTVPAREIYNVGADDQNFQKKALGKLIQERLPQAEVVYRTDKADKRSYKVNFGKIKALGFRPQHDPKISVDQIVSGLESGLIRVDQLEESVNVTKDDAIRKDTTEHVHVNRSRL